MDHEARRKKADEQRRLAFEPALLMRRRLREGQPWQRLIMSDEPPALSHGWSHTMLGSVPATRQLSPWRIKTAGAFSDHFRARAFERYLKSGSGRAFAKQHF